MSTERKHRQIKKIKMAKDFSTVLVSFTEQEETDFGYSQEDEDSAVIPHEYSIKGRHRPHKDFIDAMKSLRKMALEANEMTVDSKEISSWTVNGLDIAGDMFLKQSRVVLILAKTVKRTGKVSEMKTTQITMYPEKDDPQAFKDVDKLTKGIEYVIGEAWEYLNGKYDENISSQIPLFETQKPLQLQFKS
jgi:hypothetical protein